MKRKLRIAGNYEAIADASNAFYEDGQITANDDASTLFDNNDHDEEEDDANEAEMDLFTCPPAEQSSMPLPVGSKIGTGHSATDSAAISGGMMSPDECWSFRTAQKRLLQQWKLYSSELIRFRTLSHDPTYVGYHNDDYDEDFDRIPGLSILNNRPNAEIGKCY